MSTTRGAGGDEKLIMRIRSSPPVDFSRFDLYAPFVHTLHVYGLAPDYQYFKVTGSLPARNQPLLPNLKSIILRSPDAVYWQDQLAWVGSFVSPTLVDVRVIAEDARSPTLIPSLVADVVVDTLAQHCPGLCSLSLFPSEDPLPEDSELYNNFLLGLIWRRPVRQSLVCLPGLVELTCSMDMLKEDSFSVVGSLPLLNRLSILGLPGPVLTTPHALPADSFLQLRALRLIGGCRTGFISTLKLSPLTSRLTELALEFYCSDRYGFDEDLSEWVVSSLLCQLQNSPRLTQLSVKIRNPQEWTRSIDIEFEDLAEVFANLPLEVITLAGLSLDPEEYDAGLLKTAWLNVTSVHMPDHLAGLEALRCFAQLPELRYLQVLLGLDNLNDYDSEPEEVFSYCPLQTLEGSSGSVVLHKRKHVGKVAKFLLDIFPELHKVVWGPAWELTPVSDAKAQRAFIEYLNKHLALKQEV
ncbi:hypothetical protein FRC07_003692, partial [Ceratobasidium sp. 392]